ncbi:hypothetical protein ZWY2020_043877 [Hordeum vulgare]|nr:hypothetical protein ZWY2020_043877 [Hordeum vulgare]
MPPPCPSTAFFLLPLLLAVHLPPAAAADSRHASTTAAPSYRRISWASNLTLLGSASVLPGAVAVALTTNSSDGIGAGRALFSEPVRLLLPQPDPRAAPAQASFSTRFTFRITPSPSYGDGIAFVLTSSRTFLGASNGFLGLFPSASASDDGELAGIYTVAVELDTHRDVALRDPDGNHVALDAGSIFSVASASPGVDLKAGVPITAWIEYRAPRRRLRAWLSYSSSRRPDKVALSVDVDLSGLLLTYMYAGFSASNGEGTAVHVVESWTFRTFGFPNTTHASASPIPSPPPNPKDQASLKSPLPLPKNNHHHHNLFYTVLGGALGGVVLLVLVVSSSILWIRHSKRRTGEKTAVLFDDKNFRGMLSMEVVRAATKDFCSENVIGIGGSGAIVFEGVLPSGSRVAVKRFQAMLPCSKAFLSELRAMLDCPHHPNLVPLLGWCSSEHDLVLVYEFMPNGNLDSALHTKGGATLPWEARFRAVLGVASALTFLHDECEHRILHRDVKSSNVLLDGDFNARLGDFGLARVLSLDTYTRYHA